MNNIIYIAAACIIDSDNRLLVVRKQGSKIFMQPGGKIELSEQPIEALVREIKEELLLDIDINVPHYIGQFDAPAANEPGYLVKAELFKILLPDSPMLTVAAEIAEARWIIPQEITTINIAPLMQTYVIPLWIANEANNKC